MDAVTYHDDPKKVLEQNGIKFDSVNYVNIIADDAFAAMVGGSVAASEFWEPYGSNVLKKD